MLKCLSFHNQFFIGPNSCVTNSDDRQNLCLSVRGPERERERERDRERAREREREREREKRGGDIEKKGL